MRKMKKVRMVSLLSAVIISSAMLLTSFGRLTVGQPAPLYIYSAKFVCSQNKEPVHPSYYGVVPGVYETDINVQNPRYGTTLTIYKRVVWAPEEPNSSIPVLLGTGVQVLPPLAAFRIDCKEIIASLIAAGIPVMGTVMGFVILITSIPDLNVVAVYTAAYFDPVTGIVGQVMSIEVERVPSTTLAP